MTNYYALLEVGMDASPDALKSAYRRKARCVHPDAGHAQTQDFHLLQEAYEILRAPAKRAAYDRELRAWAASLGHVLCDGCGVANRVPRIPSGFAPRCGRCGAALPVTEPTRRSALRTALAQQAVGIAEDVGGEVLALARDAAVTGLRHLRKKVGMPMPPRRKS